MLIILPLLALPLFFFSLNYYRFSRNFIFREKVITSIILWSLAFTAITEIFSIPHLINTFGLSVCWIAIDTSLLYRVLKQPIKVPLLPKLKSLDLFTKIELATIGFIFSVTLILAISVAPNNIDVLSYQLGRIPHWIQNQSVEYYATNISWQLFLAPFASYPKLHFQILSGGDYFSNIIQWFFAFGNILVVSLITKYFGGNNKIQLLAAFITATIPIGILEASTSQDDHILTFFLACFIYFSFSFKSWKKDWRLLLLAGISLGLGYLTKQLVYIYSFPFLFWFLWSWTSKFGLRKAFALMLMILIPAFIINLGFLYRSFFLNGLPFFSVPTSAWDIYINHPVGIESLISGVIKNIAINLSTPIPLLNEQVHNLAVLILNALQIDPNKSGLNSQSAQFVIPPFIASEYFAPNLIHLLLILISPLFILRHYKKTKSFLFCLISVFILICAILSWHIANSRYLIPLFVLWTPLLALSLNKTSQFIKIVLILTLMASSFYFLFFNTGKPIIGKKPIFMNTRYEQYFLNIPLAHDKSISISYKKMAEYVRSQGFKRIGVVFNENDYPLEYPLWIALSSINKNITVEHVDVQNSSRNFTKDFKPQIILFIAGDKSVIKKYIRKNIPVIGLSN